MNNALFQNVNEWCFFSLSCLLLLLFFVFIIFLNLEFNCFFNHKNTSFFAHRYVPAVIKGKRIAVGLFQCSLAEDGIMFVL